jgi:hypothetical protein
MEYDREVTYRFYIAPVLLYLTLFDQCQCIFANSLIRETIAVRFFAIPKGGQMQLAEVTDRRKWYNQPVFASLFAGGPREKTLGERSSKAIKQKLKHQAIWYA